MGEHLVRMGVFLCGCIDRRVSLLRCMCGCILEWSDLYTTKDICHIGKASEGWLTEYRTSRRLQFCIGVYRFREKTEENDIFL